MTYSDKAAERGEPGYVWRSGQDRRLAMIRQWSDLDGRILDNGTGLGTYLEACGRINPDSLRIGLEIEHDRAVEALSRADGIVLGVGEGLPFADDSFDLILSNEVLEHVADDRACAAEMARVTRPGGRIVIFAPNRWYPVEQHGIYWRGEYYFGNKPLVNYLPDPLRNRLAPHVRTYTAGGRIFGGYDNIVRRSPRLGGAIRRALYAAEGTPLAVLGLSHFLVLEKVK
ncbi:MAG: class I SAM-dependent methyltransferase [Anaerolineae bacterium]|nr:MAG: class I SAM-dependent methyltransferase [Anaerolineae bacterium]